MLFSKSLSLRCNLTSMMIQQMLSNQLCIYITGLPAAGKTTVARFIANHYSLPLLDKDDYLEQLFETHLNIDMAKRSQLSREADQFFVNDALQQETLVLVSHWRPLQSKATSGTPVDWLTQNYARVIEVNCSCSVITAAQRFVKRQRHPGHNDTSRSLDEIQLWFEQYASMLPIGLGQKVQVNTESKHWQTELIEALKLHIGT